MNDSHRCPACDREFKSVLDYPRIRVLAFERMPIPEAMDNLSAAAAAKHLARRRRDHSKDIRLLEDGINMTPEIERACNSREVQDYLGFLSGMAGQEFASQHLLPPFKPHGYFKAAYPVPNTHIYLSLGDARRDPILGRIAEIQVYCDGPNMGSAGGPTLQMLGVVARVHYCGLLTKSLETVNRT